MFSDDNAHGKYMAGMYKETKQRWRHQWHKARYWPGEGNSVTDTNCGEAGSSSVGGASLGQVGGAHPNFLLFFFCLLKIEIS